MAPRYGPQKDSQSPLYTSQGEGCSIILLMITGMAANIINDGKNQFFFIKLIVSQVYIYCYELIPLL